VLPSDPAALIGRAALDAAHRPLGTVEEVLVARSTGELEFVVLSIADPEAPDAPARERLIPVPLSRARVHGDELVLQYTHAEVLGAPEFDPAAESLGPQGKQRVLDHFGERRPLAPGPAVSAPGDDPTTQVPAARPGVPPPAPPPAPAPPRPAAPGSAAPDPTEATEVVASAERLSVDTTRVPVERVRLRKVIVVEPVTITVELRREELVVEREPIDDDEPAAPGSGDARLQEDALEFVLHAEEPIVHTRVVPVERVRIAKGNVVERREIDTERRIEHVDVDHEEMA
jgi:uncharacterized protein (TIGR02271 family)